MSVPALETPRLRMRAWRAEDLEPFARLNADPAVMRYFPATLDRQETEALMARLAAHFDANGFGHWALELKESGAFIGFTGAHIVQMEVPFRGQPELGWRLAKEHWGRGYAPEAARAAAEFLFGPGRFSELVSFTAVDNGPSRRVMEKLVMTRDPREDFDHPKLTPGHPLRRHVLYRLKGP